MVGEKDLGGRGKVSLIDIQSVSGDVVVRRDINAGDRVVITGGDLSVLSGSQVYALNADSTVFMQARNNLLVSAAQGAPVQLNQAIIQAGKLLHLAAPTMTVNGLVQVTQDDGRILLSAERSIVVEGRLNAIGANGGTIDLHAGVDLAKGRDFLEGAITESQLFGGDITISGQGRLSAPGTITLLAGGDVTLDADMAVLQDRVLDVQTTRTVPEKVDVVIGYSQVADGTVKVPVISTTDTIITEQVGTELVKVGSQFATMTVKLTQIGYYNPVTNTFREVLIEGRDYTNGADPTKTKVDWNNATADPAVQRTATAPGADYKVLTGANPYKGFTELSDAQR